LPAVVRVNLSARAKDHALRAACTALRLYFRHAPGRFGKRRLWERVARPYLLWRPMRMPARSRFGASFDGSFPDLVHGFMYFFGVWEPAITALYRAALKPGDVVVDVGANVGTHALLAARLVGPTGRVHAVEASPWIHARLRQNVADNGLAGTVRTYNLAATETAGPVTVFLHDATNLGGTTILPSEADRTGAVREAVVDGLPLPEMLPIAELQKARLIKIDVEGAEWLVVRGLRPVLQLLRADAEILVEVNPAALARLGGSVEAFLGMFAEAGFQPFEVPNAYDVRFYIDPPPTAVTPLAGRDFDMADIVFRRAA
jgi:FkbM family methyltransferase